MFYNFIPAIFCIDQGLSLIPLCPLGSVRGALFIDYGLWVNKCLMYTQLQRDAFFWGDVPLITRSCHCSSGADHRRSVPSRVHPGWKSCRSAGLRWRSAVNCCCRPGHRQGQMDEHHSPVPCASFTSTVLCLRLWNTHYPLDAPGTKQDSDQKTYL